MNNPKAQLVIFHFIISLEMLKQRDVQSCVHIYRAYQNAIRYFASRFYKAHNLNLEYDYDERLMNLHLINFLHSCSRDNNYLIYWLWIDGL